MIYILTPPIEKKSSSSPDVTYTPSQKPNPNVTKPVEESELDTYFTPASVLVPEDYPRKEIGACPFAKSQKTELPMVDIPMCTLKSNKVN